MDKRDAGDPGRSAGRRRVAWIPVKEWIHHLNPRKRNMKQEKKMIEITRADKRRKASRGPFSTQFLPLGRYLKDWDDHGVAQIGRLEHATLKAGALVPMHIHQNEEILSYIRKGVMRHRDSHEIEASIHNRYLMMMNAGSGIYHEEGVREGDETVEMLQIFIRAREDDLKPDIQFLELESSHSLNEWRLLAGHEPSGAPLTFRSDVKFYDLHLEADKSITTPDLNGNLGLMYLFGGSAVIKDHDETIAEGDSILIRKEQLTLQSEVDSDIVFFELDESAPYTRNGLYTR